MKLKDYSHSNHLTYTYASSSLELHRNSFALVAIGKLRPLKTHVDQLIDFCQGEVSRDEILALKEERNLAKKKAACL
jgi:hypothetical protein